MVNLDRKGGYHDKEENYKSRSYQAHQWRVQLYSPPFYLRRIFSLIAAKGTTCLPVFGDRLRPSWAFFL
jgi:hypothetical protein